MKYEEIVSNAKYFVDQLQDNECHIVMAVARKKYNPELPSSTDYRKTGIWREIVTKKNYEDKIRKIYTLVSNYEHEIAKPEDYNFYISHNPRSYHKALVGFKQFLARYDYDPNPDMLSHFTSEWFSQLQGPSARSRKLSFVLDVDTKDETVVNNMKSLFNFFWSIETRNGYHVLVPPQFIELHKVNGQPMVKNYSNVEIGYDRLVYIGKV